MKGYGYLNARIKGMHSNLLSKEFYDQLLTSDGTAPMIDALLNSLYSPQLRDALETDRSNSNIERGLRRNLFDTFEKIRELAPPETQKLLTIQFRKWDIQNILTIIRGKVANMPAEEISRGFFPAGELGEIELQELAREDNIKTVMDTLVTWNFPFIFKLRKVVQDHCEEPNCAQMEADFMRIFFEWALNELSEKDVNGSLLRDHIQYQIDLVNIKSALWYVLQKEGGGSPDAICHIPGGKISDRCLSQIENSSSLEMCFEILAGSYFSRAIDRGILVFGEFRRLAIMERFLEIEIVKAGCKMFRADPLGIGVSIGFIWRKFNEFQNLRIILRSKAFGKPSPAIREELFFVESLSN